MNRPLAGDLKPNAVDRSTDAWDTINWHPALHTAAAKAPHGVTLMTAFLFA